MTDKIIPKGICQCGCGRPTKIAPRNRKNRGWVKGEPLAYLHGHNKLSKRGPAVEPGMKWCGTCDTVKPVSEFHFAAGQIDKLQGFCKDCGRETQMRYRERHRDRLNRQLADIRRKQRLGVEPEQYDAMLEEQGGVCAICSDKCSHKTVSGVQRALAVDHCHATGRIRGLLCSNCNTAIGLLQDDPELVCKAAEYVTYHQREFSPA